MILFIISFILVFISSYFVTSLLSPKKSILGLIYLFVIAFAQIVLTFEVLSLFTAIKEFWVLFANFAFFFCSGYIWNKKKRPLWSLDCSDFWNKLKNSLKLDKSLVWLFIGFCVLIFVSIVLCLLIPITSKDAWNYHVSRCLFWIFQGNLNHFQTPDVRNICLPINSELLYTWVLLFIKKDVLFGYFSFVGYILSITSLYNIMGYIGYCVRRRLWIIFILSSFSSVWVQATGSTETDIIIAGLVLSSIFLFWTGLKENKKIPIFMSALVYALAIGTKTTAIIMLPAVGLFMIGLCWHYKKIKEFFMLFGFCALNFLIFSSYNYILNYLQFGDFFTNDSFRIVSKNYYGFKGLVSNFIKYMFMFLDFTGFRWGDYLNQGITNLRTETLTFFHVGFIPDGKYNIPYKVNRSLLEPIMGAGILGFLVYFPCWIISMIKPLFNLKQRKNRFILAFSLMLLINILVMSYLLCYMIFSVRFLMAFMVISSPILYYSYFPRKNIFKNIIVFFAMFYLLALAPNLWPRPIVKTIPMLFQKNGITRIRFVAECTNFINFNINQSPDCLLRQEIVQSFSKKNRILIFASTTADGLYMIKNLEFEGYKIDFGILENAKNIDFRKYNLIIFPNKPQVVSVMKYHKEWTTYYSEFSNNVVKFNRKLLVPCYYEKNKTIPSDVFNIYESRCSVSPTLILQNGLEYLNSVDTGIRDVVGTSYDYYLVYRNKNLPLYQN